MVLFSIPIGLLVDRRNRVRLLWIFAALSVAGTLVTAWAPGVGALFVARMLVGIGMTGGLTAALSLAADLCAPEQRGRAVLIVTLGKSLGVAAGFALAGGFYGQFVHGSALVRRDVALAGDASEPRRVRHGRRAPFADLARTAATRGRCWPGCSVSHRRGRTAGATQLPDAAVHWSGLRGDGRRRRGYLGSARIDPQLRVGAAGFRRLGGRVAVLRRARGRGAGRGRCGSRARRAGGAAVC